MTTSINTLLTPPPDNRLWSSMPGWGIVADLTPPELIAQRHLHVLRKMIVVGLVLVLVLCGAGYFLAHQKRSSAAADRDAVQARTTQLNSELRSGAFNNVVKMQGTVAQVQSQVAQLMTSDVDLPALLVKIRAALPASMAISSLSLTLNPTGAAVPVAPGTGLDTSGRPVVGTVTVAGSGRNLDDLPAYVDRLSAIKGVINLVPTSNQATNGSARFSLTFAVTDVLYSHRYKATSGGK